MKVYAATSANDAWKDVAHDLVKGDVEFSVQSRLGTTREILHAVIELSNPVERWVVARTPAINPAFALAEVVWLLAGRDDVGFIAHWFPQYPEFVGCSMRQPAAYGKRLRDHRGLDQIERAYLALRNNPSSRQVVLQIWNAVHDMPDTNGKPQSGDVPCNVLSMLKVRCERLEWMQIVRSNDVDRGLPHNFVQFTMLQEMMAGWLGLEVGHYVHVADSMHWYPEQSQRLAIDDAVIPAQNSDRFNQSFEASMQAMAVLAARMDRIVEARRCGSAPLFGADMSLPKPFENMFAIIAADDARRHGEREAACQWAAHCDNPALRQVWRRWQERVSRSRAVVDIANVA